MESTKRKIKNVLVTGASGFTGSYLCRALADRGYRVQALVRKSSDTRKLKELGIELIEGDLAAPLSLVGKIRGIDILFHIAALYRQEGVARDLFWKVNVEGTRTLLEESIRTGVKRFVHCSTVGVQGEIKHPPADESAPYHPGDHYQESKTEGEKLALSYARENRLDVVVVRPVGIYGPGDTRFLKLFRTIYRGKFRMIGTGRVLYHLTYVEDLVDGIILAGETESASGQIFTLGGDQFLELNQLVEMIAQIFGKPVSRVKIPLFPVYLAAIGCEAVCRLLKVEPPLYRRRLDFFTKDRAFDISKACKELGYHPRVPLAEGLKRTADWYQKQGWLE